MNQFKNGTIIVVIATVIAAVLILKTGRDDTPAKSSDLTNVVVTEREVVVDDTNASETKEITKLTASEEINKENNSESEAETIAQKMISNVTAENVDAKAPKGPFKESSNETTVAKTETKSDASESLSEDTDLLVEKKKVAPVIFIEPNTVVATSEQHEVLSHIVQPIWMDQKLGDFKSIEKGEVVFKIMPNSADGLQGENPNQVVTSKSDKLSSSTVSADYNYQQMPMYNGGYYIAPMPSYLMPSMLPGKATLKSKQTN